MDLLVSYRSPTEIALKLTENYLMTDISDFKLLSDSTVKLYIES